MFLHRLTEKGDSSQGLRTRPALAGTAFPSPSYDGMKVFPGLNLTEEGGYAMIKFLLWCILLVFCWPLALLALVLYPLVWLVLLPFRIVGIAVGGVLELVGALITLPVRL